MGLKHSRLHGTDQLIRSLHTVASCYYLWQRICRMQTTAACRLLRSADFCNQRVWLYLLLCFQHSCCQDGQTVNGSFYIALLLSDMAVGLTAEVHKCI